MHACLHACIHKQLDTFNVSQILFPKTDISTTLLSCYNNSCSKIQSFIALIWVNDSYTWCDTFENVTMFWKRFWKLLLLIFNNIELIGNVLTVLIVSTLSTNQCFETLAYASGWVYIAFEAVFEGISLIVFYVSSLLYSVAAMLTFIHMNVSIISPQDVMLLCPKSWVRNDHFQKVMRVCTKMLTIVRILSLW